MQGRLSPLVNGKIQSFPWACWKQEFPIARDLGLGMMEWTLDQEDLYLNPLLTSLGQQEIRILCHTHRLSIPSLTGDCFMQAPFWKASSQEKFDLEADFISVAHACAEVGIAMIVVPLVDNARLENNQQEEALLAFMHDKADLFRQLGLRIIFESDLAPAPLAEFITQLPSDTFGINYDIGNSAALGYNPQEEFAAYGNRIVNVHVKDRTLSGTTVPLGTGNANFPYIFNLLNNVGYNGNLILQTARSINNDHVGALRQYIDQVQAWMKVS
jgi:L-ribulose-5-phosphate 3-epimerase